MFGSLIAIGLYLLGAHNVYQGATAVEEQDNVDLSDVKWGFVLFWPLYELYDIVTPEPK